MPSDDQYLEACRDHVIDAAVNLCEWDEDDDPTQQEWGPLYHELEASVIRLKEARGEGVSIMDILKQVESDVNTLGSIQPDTLELVKCANLELADEDW